MKTNEFNKSMVALLIAGIGLGNVSLAQLYSSGNNPINGSKVGVGTNDPEAKLQVNNTVVLPAGGNGPSAQANDDPALRIATTVNPNNGQASSTYTWDVKTGEDLRILDATSAQPNQLLKLATDESELGGNAALIASNFHFGGAQGNTSFKYTLGLGARMNGSYLSQTTSGQSGVAFQNHNGTMRFYTGIGTNTNPLPRMTITNSGKVGIGTTNPSSALEVKNGTFKVDNGQIAVDGGDVKVKNGRIVLTDAQGVNQFEIKSDGYVIAREILVDVNEAIPDYVFEDDYQLLPLDELRSYIKSESHLPNIPSADDFANIGGIEVGELTRLLLEKQEELVLYILELESRLSKVESAKLN